MNENKNLTTVVVCHANVIRYFVCRALQLSPEIWLRFSLPHGSITWLSVFDDGTVLAKSVGDASHLPANLLTFNNISPR